MIVMIMMMTADELLEAYDPRQEQSQFADDERFPRQKSESSKRQRQRCSCHHERQEKEVAIFLAFPSGWN